MSARPIGMSRSFRLGLLAALYCTQNLSLGMFTYAFLTIAQTEGVPLATIGAASGLATLLVLKFLWAPVVDRFGSRRLGHYRGWLLGSQAVLVLGCGSLSVFDPAEDFAQLLCLFAVLFIVAGTQDIAADATATRLLPPTERGLGNGIQAAGSQIAQVIDGGLVLVIYDVAGWQAAALFPAAWSAVPLPFVLAWNDKRSTAAQPIPYATLGALRTFFARPVTRLWTLVVLPLYFAGVAMSQGVVRPIFVDEGWSESRIGMIVVIVGSIFGVVFGLVAGALIKSLGRRRAFLGLGVVQAMGCLGVIALALGATQVWFAIIVVALVNAGVAAATAVVYTISMDLTRPESAGTDFTLFSTLASLVMVLAGGIGMGFSGSFGFGPIAVAALVLCLGGIAFASTRLDVVIAAGGAEGATARSS